MKSNAISMTDFEGCLCLTDLAGRSRRGSGNDSYCDAGPQEMLNCAEGELTWLAASGDSVLRALFPEVGSRTAEL